MGLIRSTAKDKAKAVFFSKLIIITALVPIFSFQKVEGKMFSPLAYTLGFALLGALIFTLTLVPVLSSMLLKRDVRERNNCIVRLSMKSFVAVRPVSCPSQSHYRTLYGGGGFRIVAFYFLGNGVSSSAE